MNLLLGAVGRYHRCDGESAVSIDFVEDYGESESERKREKILNLLPYLVHPSLSLYRRPQYCNVGRLLTNNESESQTLSE